MGVATLDFGFVQPNDNSTGGVSQGIYSLSSKSTVPFVEFRGRSGYQKVFSWGEIVEVPKNERVTVRNASYHAGDIVINTGADYDNRPARITVPVPMITVAVPLAETNYRTGQYPCDVRLARRAYMLIDFDIQDVLVQAQVIGKKVDGSHDTGNQLASFTDGVGYQESYLFPLFTELGPVPLGKGVGLGDDSRPHNLLTTGQVYFSPVGQFGAVTSAYYIVEY